MLKLTKVGSTACEAKVRSVAEACPGVVKCDVDIDTGVATVAAAAGVDADEVRATLNSALAKAGYERCPRRLRSPGTATGVSQGSRRARATHWPTADRAGEREPAEQACCCPYPPPARLVVAGGGGRAPRPRRRAPRRRKRARAEAVEAGAVEA